MKILLALLFVVLLAGSLLADFHWRRWMRARRREREGRRERF